MTTPSSEKQKQQYMSISMEEARDIVLCGGIVEYSSSGRDAIWHTTEGEATPGDGAGDSRLLWRVAVE
jgi:hypothetical protein